MNLLVNQHQQQHINCQNFRDSTCKELSRFFNSECQKLNPSHIRRRFGNLASLMTLSRAIFQGKTLELEQMNELKKV